MLCNFFKTGGYLPMGRRRWQVMHLSSKFSFVQKWSNSCMLHSYLFHPLVMTLSFLPFGLVHLNLEVQLPTLIRSCRVHVGPRQNACVHIHYLKLRRLLSQHLADKDFIIFILRVCTELRGCYVCKWILWIQSYDGLPMDLHPEIP